MGSRDNSRQRKKRRTFKWDSESPEQKALEELSQFLALLRARRGISVLKLAAILDVVKHHLNEYLVEEGLDD